jgi:hypothetical protein
MTPLLIVVAVAVLLALAAVVGAIEGRAQRSAWARIAEQRRSLGLLREALAAEREGLVAWELALADETERRPGTV